MQPRIHPIASADGVTLTVEEWGAATDKASLVFLPALGVPLAYYGKLLAAWAARGRHLVAVELRGGPGSPVPDLRKNPFGYAHLIREDLPAVVAAVPAPRVVTVGHSLGGQLALLSAAAGTVRPEAVVTLATGTSSATGATRLLRGAQARFITTVGGLLGYWPGHRFGFGGRQPRQLMSDWAHEARHGRYRLGGDPTDYEAALASLAVPALLADIRGDTMIPAASVDHLAARVPTAERIGIDAHPDHFLWARRAPGAVVDAVETWIGCTV
jgi:predicted alpha/beta hydrolase